MDLFLLVRKELKTKNTDGESITMASGVYNVRPSSTKPGVYDIDKPGFNIEIKPEDQNIYIIPSRIVKDPTFFTISELMWAIIKKIFRPFIK